MRRITSQIEMPGLAAPPKSVQDAEADVGADHEHVAVGEVEELEDPVHHRVPEGDQRVDAAERRRVDDRLEEPVEIDGRDRQDVEEQAGPVTCGDPIPNRAEKTTRGPGASPGPRMPRTTC